jgi:SAM-dependent methyltransferase
MHAVTLAEPVFRRWDDVLDRVPLQNQTVVSVGCTEIAAKLARRGADVIVVDSNEGALAAARRRYGLRATFVRYDVGRSFPPIRYDGLWCSFGAAKFPSFGETLARWTRHLRPGGWVAITEVDNLFGHEPLSEWVRAVLETYATDALRHGRHDFFMGRKLSHYARAAGLEVAGEMLIADSELAFEGPASPETLRAWHERIEAMASLRAHPTFEHVRDELLRCLARPDHHCRASVVCSIATKP